MTTQDRGTVLVTGVSGRIGANLALGLMAEGYRVRGMVMPADPASWKLEMLPGVEVVHAVLTDQDALMRAVAGVDVVIHLAAQMPVGDTPIDAYLDINTLGTVRLLEASRRSDPPVQQFVFVSTDSTYGPTKPAYLPLDEEHPQVPGEYYGMSKVLAEGAVVDYAAHFGIPYTILRYGSVLAPDEVLLKFRYGTAQALFGQAARGKSAQLWRLFEGVTDPAELLRRQVPEPSGNPAISLTDVDGSAWRIHYTDVRDTVSGTLAALGHPAAIGEAFNIIGPPPVTWVEGAKIVSEALGIDVIPVSVPFHLDFTVSGAKAERVLGFVPVWTLERMVASALGESDEDRRVIPALAAPPPA